MANPQAEARSARSQWAIPLFPDLPVAPLWIWLLLTACWMAAYLVYAWLLIGSGIFGAAFWKGWGLTVFQDALLIGYLPAAVVWGRRQAQRTLGALRPVLAASESELAELSLGLERVDARTLVIGSFVALFAGALLATYNVWLLASDPAMAASLLERLGFTAEQIPSALPRVAAWEATSLVVVAVLVWLFSIAESALPRRISEIAERRAHIALIDLGPLHPLTEQGLGGALRVVAVAVVASVGLLVVPEDLLVVFGIFAAPVAGAAALLAPVRGVRGRIQREKQAELARTRAELGAALESGSGGAEGGRIADLLAYEARIESINPWLVDRSGLLRFGIIVGAGMSMLGGALVERLVAAVLD